MKNKLELVESGKLSVSAYLDHKMNITPYKPYKYKDAHGLKVIFLVGKLLFVSPKIPFWLLQFLTRFVHKINIENTKVIESISLKEIIPLLKTLGKNNLIIGVSSPKSNVHFEVWGV